MVFRIGTASMNNLNKKYYLAELIIKTNTLNFIPKLSIHWNQLSCTEETKSLAIMLTWEPLKNHKINSNWSMIFTFHNKNLWKNTVFLTSSLFFSFTKKRILVLKTVKNLRKTNNRLQTADRDLKIKEKVR